MIYVIIIATLIGLDQLSKYWALEYLQEIGSIPIIENIFHLTYVENRGAAFGMLKDNQIIFIIVAMIVTIGGIYYLNTRKIHRLGQSAIVMIIAGAIGNMIDRVRLGFVVDYFDFRFIWEYVFNVADIFVVVGTIMLCIYIVVFEEKDKLENDKLKL